MQINNCLKQPINGQFFKASMIGRLKIRCKHTRTAPTLAEREHGDKVNLEAGCNAKNKIYSTCQ
jgi:hypothetical protein